MIAIHGGLLGPAIGGCESLDLEAVASVLRNLVALTRAGHLRPTESSGGTFTPGNVGMFGVSAFAAIITPPQVAILATGPTEPRAVVRDSEIAVRRMRTATLSADRRTVDGAAAAAFLDTLRAVPSALMGATG